MINAAPRNLARHMGGIAIDGMVAPVVAAGNRPAIPPVLPVIRSILNAIFLEDVVVEQKSCAVHQISAHDPIIIDVILGDVAVLRAAHAQAKTIILTQYISRKVQSARGLNIDTLAVS